MEFVKELIITNLYKNIRFIQLLLIITNLYNYYSDIVFEIH